MSDDATQLNANSIDDIFLSTVRGLQNTASTVRALNQSATGPSASRATFDTIDIELTFKSVNVSTGGGLKKLLWSDKQTSSTLEVRLATRVRVETT